MTVQTNSTLTAHRGPAQRRRLDRGYVAYGAAAKMWGDRNTEVIISGPAGTGKSRAVLEKMHFMCMKYKGIRVLMVRKTRESMTESVLVTYEEHVLGEGHPIIGRIERKNRTRYHYPNGSLVVVGGMTSGGRNQNARVMSTEYDIIVCFETTEFDELEWEQLITRLRNNRMPYQQIIGDCNPDAPTHWIKLRGDNGKCSFYYSVHQDNPVLFDGVEWTKLGIQYLDQLSRLTGVRLLRYRDGLWVAAEGQVYEYLENVHTLERQQVKIQPSWRRIRVIDFGYVNAFVCQWWAIDGDRNMVMYRELYVTNKLVEDIAPIIISLTGNERIEATIADHDAEDRATLEKHGIPTIPARKSIGLGIQKVQARMKVNADTGRPRIFFIRDALVERDPILVEQKRPWMSTQEFATYVWPKGGDGKPIKEIPEQSEDHGMDCLRYGVMYLDGDDGEHDLAIPTLQAESIWNLTGLALE